MRKLDPEEEDDPFNSYEVPPEARLESFPSAGPHRLSSDSATFMESGRSRCRRRCWGVVQGCLAPSRLSSEVSRVRVLDHPGVGLAGLMVRLS